jgi:serine/threonine protein kinase
VIDLVAEERIAFKTLLDLSVPVEPQGALTREDRLGSGTYGEVYRVVDSQGRSFASKSLLPHYDKHRDFPQYNCVFREVSALVAFQGHPNIIRAFSYDLNWRNSRFSIVMELMDGDLVSFCKKHATQSQRMPHLRSIARQILSALNYLHSENFSHRDVKSGNILYRIRGGHMEVKVSRFFPPFFVPSHSFPDPLCFKLGDLGLVRCFNGPTYTGAAVTESYRPPELLFSKSKDAKYGTEIDMWSLGVVLSEVMLGSRLTRWETGDALIARLSTIFDLTPYINRLDKEKRYLVTTRAPRGLVAWLSKHLGEDRLDQSLCSLLEGLLQVDPARRLTARDALRYPYLSLGNRVADEPARKARFLPPSNSDWMSRHEGIDADSRDEVLSWLLQRCTRNELHAETYSQSVEILDAFMAKTTRKVTADDLMLYAAASLFLSNNLNEVYYIHPDDVADMTTKYTDMRIVEATFEIFQCLDYLLPKSRSRDEQRRSGFRDLVSVFQSHRTVRPNP